MWPIDYSGVEELDEFSREQNFRAGCFAFFVMGGLLLTIALGLVVASAFVFSASTLALWPILASVFDNVWIRSGAALSFLTIGLAFYYLRVERPLHYAAVQIGFGLALCWAALSSLSMDHVTVVLALLGAVYAMTSGIGSIQQHRLPPPPETPMINFGMKRVSHAEVYQGDRLLGRVQKYSSKLVYQIHLKPLVDRITALERQLGSEDGKK
jgi:hypothetical protein